ncbi:MAG: hypothetical protein ABIV51_03420 [Saprospiraceae bacterium]
MQPRFEHSSARFFIGKKIITRLANNDTRDLWQSFMPLRTSIPNRISEDLFSIEIYDPQLDFFLFDSQSPFEKWAAVEVQMVVHYQ